MKLLDETRIPDHPYPELRNTLHTFVDEIAAELRENLVGIYLVGSIASGDFDLDSDIDFFGGDKHRINRSKYETASRDSNQDS